MEKNLEKFLNEKILKKVLEWLLNLTKKLVDVLKHTPEMTLNAWKFDLSTNITLSSPFK